jgi:ketosteroid isomerase-like protein
MLGSLIDVRHANVLEMAHRTDAGADQGMAGVRFVRVAGFFVLWFGCQIAWAGVADEIIAGLERYRVAVLELDIESQVASFAEDAQFSQDGDAVVQGRNTIRGLLQSQAGYKVVGYELLTAATRVQGPVAFQNGLYTERIMSPQHEAKITKGVFEVEWARQADGSWLISRWHTVPVEGDSP